MAATYPFMIQLTFSKETGNHKPLLRPVFLAQNANHPLAGPLEFHRNSLQHLSEAMRRTRRLCSTVIDTMGRELMVRGQWQVNDQVRELS